jgi:hypothetical protein
VSVLFYLARKASAAQGSTEGA